MTGGLTEGERQAFERYVAWRRSEYSWAQFWWVMGTFSVGVLALVGIVVFSLHK